jgi:hypothetical protein
MASRSGLLARSAKAGDPRELLETCDFSLQCAAAESGEAIGLASASGIVFVEAFDPAVIEQAAECSVESAGAEYDAAVADFLDIFENGIPVARLSGKTDQNE